MSILQLVLCNDANCLKDSLMFFMSMAKPLCQDLEVLETRIQAFMASPSTSLELLDLRCVYRVSDGASGVLVGTVGNHFFPGWNLALESIWCSEILEITLSRTLRTSDPDNSIFVDSGSNLVGNTRSIKLLRVPFSAWNFTRLVNAAVDAINSDDEDFIMLIKIYPNNPCRQGCLVGGASLHHCPSTGRVMAHSF
jgi:hypothetical protein